MRGIPFVIALALLGSSAGWAQTAPPPGDAAVGVVTFEAERSPVRGSEWGTSSSVVTAVVSTECTPYLTGWDAPYLIGTILRYVAATNGFFVCGVHLPAGALIQSLELQGCDTSTTNQVQVILQRVTGSSGPVTLGQLDTGVASASGCGWYSTGVPAYTADNYYDTYFIQVNTTAGDVSTSFTSARVYYKLQVSPAPATATFADVPTSSTFFKYVEALYASGLIAGCGGGNYCPNNPVTRGQMAVYLAGALGMHWPY